MSGAEREGARAMFDHRAEVSQLDAEPDAHPDTLAGDLLPTEVELEQPPFADEDAEEEE